ncbi:hypothetical protein ACM46_12150 [Chryseobacterium angstadtii]|uniref:Secretion system C-terminal sorting domain-containing protein n=1 Tax=Chryseobacterium angstadtii TaxID=558151 RepID=A0A0J7L7C2_9FLAO|nr:T9SS type A sorting domain-containing protein [Chryseobacterium angstadtii]KMQ64950.1 hypothetical protein ACM46_12150 [Chryseobacterium angstadtii]
MKKLLLSAVLMTGTLFHAQSAELLSTTWYLRKVIKSNITYMPPQNNEIGSPTLTFTPTSGSSGTTTNMSSPICGTSIWAMIYLNEITASQFSFWTAGVGNNSTCTQPGNISFFNQYSNYFAFSNLHNYEITYSGNTKNLVLTNDYGDKAFYDSAFLGTKEESGTSKATSIKIYPNPVKDSFLEVKGAERMEWTKIYNAEGKLIQQNSADSGIDVSGLPKGGYFLEIKSQKGISRHSFIKE